MNITTQERRDPRTGEVRTLYLVHDERGKHYGTYRDRDRAAWRVFQILQARRPARSRSKGAKS